MPCQFHGLGWEWCMLSHHSRCYRLYSARFIVLMLCQWFSLLCTWWQHHGCQSYSSSPDVFPYHWKGMHFSYNKFECPEVTCSNAGNRIQLLTHVSEQCSSIFSWTNQSNETWCHNGNFISSCHPCYDLPFLMEQSIDPGMMSLTKNGGSSKQHFSCCCQEEILSACFMCVNLPLHTWRCAESVVSLLPHSGFLAKNQMPDQALQQIRIPASLISTQMSQRECCVGKVMWIHHLVHSVFHSTWDKFCLGDLAEGAKATPVLCTYYGDMMFA